MRIHLHGSDSARAFTEVNFLVCGQDHFSQDIICSFFECYTVKPVNSNVAQGRHPSKTDTYVCPGKNTGVFFLPASNASNIS